MCHCSLFRKIMPRQRNQLVRKYFTHDAISDTNACNIEGCNRNIKGNHAGNMLKHLQIYHTEDYNLVASDKKRKFVLISDFEQANADKKQNKVHFGGFPGKAKSDAVLVNISAEAIKRACVEMVTANGRPFASVDDSGFRKILDPIVQAINSTPIGPYLTINRSSTEFLVQEEANDFKIKVREEVKDKVLSLKLDCATRSKRSVLVINVQFVENAAIVVRSLAVMELTEKHTGDYLTCKIIDVLENYGINIRMIYTITSDNGANILETTNHERFGDECLENDSRDSQIANDYFQSVLDDATQNLKLYVTETEDADEGNVHIFGATCAAHALQLAVNDSLKDQEIWLRTVRALVKTMRTPLTMRILNQKNVSIPPIDCATRWPATYNMIEILLKSKSSYLGIPNIPIQSINWEKVKEIVEALAPAARAAKIFQLQQLTMTDFYVEWLKCKLATSKLKTPFAKVVMENLKKREEGFLENVATKSAIFLDPRLQATLSEENRRHAKTHLKNIWESLSDANKRRGEMRGLHNEAQSSNMDEFAEYITEISTGRPIKAEVLSPDREVNIDELLDAFDLAPRIDHEISILDFWEQTKLDSPALYAISQVVFGVPAGQVTVERAFSSLEFILSSKDNLNEQMLENVLLVRLNKLF